MTERQSKVVKAQVTTNTPTAPTDSASHKKTAAERREMTSLGSTPSEDSPPAPAPRRFPVTVGRPITPEDQTAEGRPKTPGELARQNKLIHVNADGAIGQVDHISVEINAPKTDVSITVDENGRALWVTVDGATVLRVTNAPVILVHDPRA